jgi:hypothetical protein
MESNGEIEEQILIVCLICYEISREPMHRVRLKALYFDRLSMELGVGKYEMSLTWVVG